MVLRDRFIAELEYCRLSPICLFELEYGAAEHPESPIFRRRIENLRQLILPAPEFGEDAAFQAAQIRAFLERLKPNAQPIGPFDTLIAGQALAMGAILVTSNTKEFARVPGLTLEDWSQRA